MTRGEIAKALGVSTRTIDGWRENGCPRTPDGKFVLADIEKWKDSQRVRAAKNRSAGAATKGSMAEELAMEELLTKRAKRIQEEIAAKVAEGKAILLEDVERERVARILEVRQALETLGARVVPQLQGLDVDEAIAIVDEHVRAICDRFARGGATRRSIKRGPGRPRKNG